ncbi:MAG: hypothetical protein WA770_16650, partial [Pseudolabrys sp.]
TKLHFVPAAGADDLPGAFSVMTKERAEGFIVFPSPILFGQYQRIVALAANNRLPAMYAAREGVELGGLSSYGVNLPDLSERLLFICKKSLMGRSLRSCPYS